MPDAAHIGIVACSAEGAALCYRTICTEGAAVLGPYRHPEVSMHTHPLASYVDRIEAGDWKGVADLMLVSASKLANSGAVFLICPDNTIHQAFDYVVPRSPLPWLHIGDVVADQARARGYHVVGIMGTRWLVDSDVYPEKLAARGIDYMRPTADERDETHRIIIEELLYERFTARSEEYLRDVIDRMKNDGCDAVALGCTELPLVLNEVNSPLPVLDSTRLLARAAVRRATGRLTAAG